VELNDIRLGLSATDRKRLSRLLQREVEEAGFPEGFGRGCPSETKIVLVGVLRLWRRPRRRIRKSRASAASLAPEDSAFSLVQMVASVASVHGDSPGIGGEAAL